jgi:hypothetical protein
VGGPHAYIHSQTGGTMLIRSPAIAGKATGLLHSPHTLGALSLTLWLTGLAVSTFSATLAYDNLRLLILAGGVLTTDLAAAVVTTLMWIVSRQYVQPHDGVRAENEYCYRAGYRDATARFLNSGAELSLVQSIAPVPERAPRQSNGHLGTGDRAH